MQVLDVVTDMQYTLQLLVLPKSGETIVGGNVELEAGRLSLACMHGEMNASRSVTVCFVYLVAYYDVNHTPYL